MNYESGGGITDHNIVKTEYYQWDRKHPGGFSNRFVEKANFLSMDFLSMGYQLPLPATAAVRKLMLSLTVQNVFLKTRYSGIDPEVRLLSGYYSAAGVDPGPFNTGVENTWNHPRTRTVSLALNLEF